MQKHAFIAWIYFIRLKLLVTFYLLFQNSTKLEHPWCFNPHGHCDSDIVVDLDLLYGSLRAEVSDNSAVFFCHFDNDAVVAFLQR